MELHKNMKNRKAQNSLVRGVKKFLLSAFLVITFSAYALENRVTVGGTMPIPAGASTTPAGTSAGRALSSEPAAPTTAPAGASAGTALASEPAAPTTTPAGTSAGIAIHSAAPAAPTAEATATSAAALTTSSGYKDGTYTGPTVDVRWGNVQVEATIHGGKISNVQFVQYPSDRRTSARINSIANPELQQEAIQAQSADVNIITGATLTSEGFQMSLQAALDQARS